MSEENQAAAPSPSPSPAPDPLAGVMISSGDSDEYRPLEKEQAADDSEDDGDGGERGQVDSDDDQDDGGDTDVESSAEDDDGEEGDEEERKAYQKLTKEQQKFVDEKVVPKITARYKAQIEAEQARSQQMEQELAQLREQTGYRGPEVDPETGAPVIPPAPDPFDSKYDEKLEERDQAIRRLAAWESQEAGRQEQWQAQQQKNMQELDKQTSVYKSEAKKMGISESNLLKYGQAINDAGGLPMDVIVDVLRNEVGPGMTRYFAENPAEVQKMHEMSPYQQGQYLEKHVAPAAKKLLKRIKSPPPPVGTERGRGSADEEGPPGVTYE